MLTENAIKIIENAIGITGLQEMITNTEALEIVPKKTKHFAELDYNVLVENLSSQGLTPEKYAEAKQAGEEMAIKEIKRLNSLEFEGKTAKALSEYYQKQIELKSKTDVSEIEKTYKSDLEKLQKTIETERSEKEKIIQQRKMDKINWEVDNHFNSLQIEAPPTLKDVEQISTFRKNEIEKNKIYFKSQHQFDVDENGIVIIKGTDGKILKDELLVPVKIENKVKEFAAQNFITYGQQGIKGRGGKDEFSGNNILSGIKTVDQLYEYAEKQGIKKNTSEFDAVYAEFKKNNKT
jgi:hypothetical protein